jgi:hypothetical protein
MLLVARTDDGFATRLWKDDNVLPGGDANSWSGWQPWQFDPQNPPFDWTGLSFEPGPIPPVPGWPLLGYIDQDGVYRANGFFAFADVQAPTGDPHVVVGQPWWRIPVADVAFDTFPKDFLPRVGTTWYSTPGPTPNPPGPTPRLNIFGAAVFEAANLRELYWDGANWNWHDHNRGPNGDALGASSLIFPQPNHGYLFGVTAERDNIGLFAYQPSAADWDWADFHGPEVTDLRAPVALTYSDDRGINVSVFTVGRLNNGEYHLFSIHQIFGNDWEAWQDYGAPPDEPASPCEDLPPTPDIIRTRFLSGEAFTMTSACVALDDQGLHIHLFGHSDIVPLAVDPRAEGGGVGRGALVHFSWEGGDWRNGSWGWEVTTRPVECLNVDTEFGPARLQTAFETTSSAVYQGRTQDGQTRRRISAVGMTRPGNNNGNVWEYALDTALGQEFQWVLLE